MNAGVRAFTLIELLVVIAIFGIMASLAVPGLSSIVRAGALARGGQAVGDQIILARQEAQSRNRDVEVRLIELDDPETPGYRAVQLWAFDEYGNAPAPLGRLVKLPEGVVIATNELSPLLFAEPDLAGATNFPSAGSRPYQAFRIRAGGRPSSAITSANNYLTVQLARDTGVPPANFYAVRLDPLTGRLSIHRP